MHGVFATPTGEHPVASRQAEQARRARYLSGVSVLTEKADFIVSAASANNLPLDDFATAWANQLQAKGKKATSAVFSTAFVEEGGFSTFFRGQGSADIQAMQLARQGNRLLLARCDSVAHSVSASLEGLHSEVVKMSFTVVDSADGRILDGFQLSAIGPGTSEADAKTAAFDRILEQLSKRGF